MGTYKVSVTLWKALFEFLAVTVGVGAGAAAVNFPETWEEFQQIWPALAAPLILAAWKAIRNWWKNGGKDWINLPWGGFVIVLASFTLMGCATPLLPSLSGRTTYDMHFGDAVGPVDAKTGMPQADGQNTVFDVRVKAGAGTDIADLVAMGYEWKPEEGKISVSKEATQDTSGQAAALTTINAANAAAVSAIVTGAFNAAAQILPVYWQANASTAQTQQAADAATAAARLQALQAIVDRLIAAANPIP
jgi:hypothetical protein